MLDLLCDLMGKVPARCAYAEARHVAGDSEDLAIRNGQIDDIASSSSEGIGVRVRLGGAWGFAATRDVSAAGAEAALTRAIAIAEAQPAAGDAPLAAVTAAQGHWESTYEIDPFEVALEEKLGLLFAAEAALRGDPRIVRATASARAWRERKAFASTEGAACTQHSVACGAGIAAYAAADGELQVRSYPLAHGGDFRAAGWEHVVELALAANAPRVERGSEICTPGRAGSRRRPTWRRGSPRLPVAEALYEERLINRNIIAAGSRWHNHDLKGAAAP